MDTSKPFSSFRSASKSGAPERRRHVRARSGATAAITVAQFTAGVAEHVECRGEGQPTHLIGQNHGGGRNVFVEFRGWSRNGYSDTDHLESVALRGSNISLFLSIDDQLSSSSGSDPSPDVDDARTAPVSAPAPAPKAENNDIKTDSPTKCILNNHKMEERKRWVHEVGAVLAELAGLDDVAGISGKWSSGEGKKKRLTPPWSPRSKR